MALMTTDGVGIFLVKGVIIGVDRANVVNVFILTTVAQLSPEAAIVGFEPDKPDGDDGPDDT